MSAAMALAFSSALKPNSLDHEARRVLSGIAGSISLTAWICLLVPQMVKIYRTKSADGLSMAFIIIWIFGDLTSLIGALFLHLAPSVVALGLYFIVADCILVTQCAYYKARQARLKRIQLESSIATATSENSALLGGRRGSKPDPCLESQTAVSEPGHAGDMTCWHNVVSLASVYLVGIGAWLLPYAFGIWDATPDTPAPSASEKIVQVGTILGYLSALCYLCARIPQIRQNYQQKSCEGLSLLFFLLSLTGNLMLGLSIVCYAENSKQLLDAMPWMLGTFGTIIQDCIIFVQFHLYDSRA